jgi:hypothetical protein
MATCPAGNGMASDGLKILKLRFTPFNIFRQVISWFVLAAISMKITFYA